MWATESAFGVRGLKGFVTRHQAALLFPLLTLLAVDLKFSRIDLQGAHETPRVTLNCKIA